MSEGELCPRCGGSRITARRQIDYEAARDSAAGDPLVWPGFLLLIGSAMAAGVLDAALHKAYLAAPSAVLGLLLGFGATRRHGRRFTSGYACRCATCGHEWQRR